LLPCDAAFLAGKAFVNYRRRGHAPIGAAGFLHRGARGDCGRCAAHARRAGLSHVLSQAAGDCAL